MNIIPIQNTILPLHLKKNLDELCNDLINATKDNLIAIVVYGGLAKEEFDENGSDVNLMLIFKRLTLETLDKINPLLQRGIQQLLLDPFILSEEDVEPSASLFPIKFRDIKENHIVLWGEDRLSSINIPQEHILRNCQREIRNLLLRMNQFYIQHYGFEEKLKFKILNSYSTLIVNLKVLLSIDKGLNIQAKADIVEAAIKHYALDEKLIDELILLKNRNKQYTNLELKRLYSEFLEVVRRLANVAENLS